MFLTTRFFVSMGALVALFALSFGWGFLMPIAQTIGLVLLALVLSDVLILYQAVKIPSCTRSHAKILSLNCENEININIAYDGKLLLTGVLIDELPYQLQKRDFKVHLKLASNKPLHVNYNITPKERGIFNFGNINLLIKSALGLVERRIKYHQQSDVAVYPSILEMKQYELMAFSKISVLQGIKKIRRLGHSYEFEQIKEYVPGDDYRSINWKATSRQQHLMVNHYEDERAQQIYCLLDKGRSMRMPFYGLSLLDYAINTSLVISNVALLKSDRPGIVTFDHKLHQFLKADSRRQQLHRILELLYKEQEGQTEAHFDLLYTMLQRMIKGRSLLFLFTNFESNYHLRRAIPFLRKIGKQHLLVVVVFENTEISKYSAQPVQNLQDIYNQTIASQFIFDKKAIVEEIKQYGIQTIYTKPEELSLQTLNKYLELKARGLI